MKTGLKFILSALLGNSLGGLAWIIGQDILPLIWDNLGATFIGMLASMILSTIVLAAPPVLIPAVIMHQIRIRQLWFGPVCNFWAFSFYFNWPRTIPLVSKEFWLAPIIILLLSGLLAAWVITSQPEPKT